MLVAGMSCGLCRGRAIERGSLRDFLVGATELLVDAEMNAGVKYLRGTVQWSVAQLKQSATPADQERCKRGLRLWQTILSVDLPRCRARVESALLKVADDRELRFRVAVAAQGLQRSADGIIAGRRSESLVDPLWLALRRGTTGLNGIMDAAVHKGEEDQFIQYIASSLPPRVSVQLFIARRVDES